MRKSLSWSSPYSIVFDATTDEDTQTSFFCSKKPEVAFFRVCASGRSPFEVAPWPPRR